MEEIVRRVFADSHVPNRRLDLRVVLHALLGTVHRVQVHHVRVVRVAREKG